MLNTSVHIKEGTFSQDYVGDVVPLLMITLMDAKVKAKIHDSRQDNYFDFLSTVGRIIEEVDVATDKDDLNNINLEEEVPAVKQYCAAALAEIKTITRAPKAPKRKESTRTPVPVKEPAPPAVEMSVIPNLPPTKFLASDVTEEDALEKRDSLDDDANRTYVAVKKPAAVKKEVSISKKFGYNRYMVDNIWTVGNERLLKDDAKETRAAAAWRIDRKRKVTRVRSKIDSETSNGAAMDEIKEEKCVGNMPWKRFAMKDFPEFYE